MTVEPVTIEQRIVQLETAALIHDGHNQPAFAKALRDQIDWLKTIQKRENENAQRK